MYNNKEIEGNEINVQEIQKTNEEMERKNMRYLMPHLEDEPPTLDDLDEEETYDEIPDYGTMPLCERQTLAKEGVIEILNNFDKNGYLAKGWLRAIENGYIYPSTYDRTGLPDVRTVIREDGTQFRTHQCGCLLTEASLIMWIDSDQFINTIMHLLGRSSGGKANTIMESFLAEAVDGATNKEDKIMGLFHEWITEWMSEKGY